ncbi:MAG: DUF4097 family beta strand repeat-containing protein [Gemmatimonadaceae bacterium]|nr:DUF4097 family beta strand repeat-containing protein [Gemmatimonadaceae bacterium]
MNTQSAANAARADFPGTRRGPVLRVLLLCVLTTAAASAQGTVDERMAADPRGKVEVGNVAGRVQVEGWEQHEVAVTGTLGRGVKEVRLERHGGTIEVEVVHDSRFERFRDHGEARLVVQVPRASEVEVECVSADVVASGLTGDLEVDAVSGDVTVDVASAAVHAGSVTGDLELRSTRGFVKAGSVSGGIGVRLVSGEVVLESVSGDIEARVDSLEKGRAESLSGDLRFEGDLAAAGRLKLDTKTGDIELRLPGQVSAEVELEVFSGDVESDFGSGGQDPGDWNLTLGGGGARIEASTFSGDIELRRE